jgi:hypothetical protein
MRYQFSNMKIDGEERHVLCVKNDEPVDIPRGVYQYITEHSSDMEVHHSFKVSDEIQRKTDDEGNHYVWYVLSEHVTTVDRSPAAAAEAAQNAANIDYLSMMMGIDLPEEGGND